MGKMDRLQNFKNTVFQRITTKRQTGKISSSRNIQLDINYLVRLAS